MKKKKKCKDKKKGARKLCCQDPHKWVKYSNCPFSKK